MHFDTQVNNIETNMFSNIYRDMLLG